MTATPGPYRTGSQGQSRQIVYAPDGSVVADCGLDPARTLEESLANAQLFAAAPDLLECLKITAMLTRNLLDMDLPRDYFVPIRAIHRDTKDAIIPAAGALAFSPVDSSRCRQPQCYCHDESRWIPGETYLDGCPDCGCRWWE